MKGKKAPLGIKDPRSIGGEGQDGAAPESPLGAKPRKKGSNAQRLGAAVRRAAKREKPEQADAREGGEALPAVEAEENAAKGGDAPAGQGAGENRPPEEGKGDAGLLGMTLGMCLGAALGVAMDNISMWITMGMMVGLMLGMVLGRKQE